MVDTRRNAARWRGGRSALVADAAEACRRELESVLRTEGFETHLAADDEQAFDVVRRVHIDVVILQYDLPYAGALDILRSLRQSLRLRVPCVLTAEEVSPRVQLDALSEDAFAVVPKPIDRAVMKQVVRSAMRRYFGD